MTDEDLLSEALECIYEISGVSKAQIATEMEEPDRSKPPCLICGAMTEKEAEVMCWCSVDDDCCHGQELWPWTTEKSSDVKFNGE